MMFVKKSHYLHSFLFNDLVTWLIVCPKLTLHFYLKQGDTHNKEFKHLFFPIFYVTDSAITLL